MMGTFLMVSTSSITVQSLGKFEQRTLAVGAKISMNKRHMDLLGHAKFHANRFKGAGMQPKISKISSF